MNLERQEALTVERWQRLPWLLPRATVLEWTGMSRKELDQAVADGRLRRLKARRKSKYFKTEVAALVRLVA